jgi:hypothetical protein
LKAARSSALPGRSRAFPRGVGARRASPSGLSRSPPPRRCRRGSFLSSTWPLLYSTRLDSPFAASPHEPAALGFTSQRFLPFGTSNQVSPSFSDARNHRASPRRPRGFDRLGDFRLPRPPRSFDREHPWGSLFRAFSSLVNAHHVSVATSPPAGWPPLQSSMPLAPHRVVSAPRLQGLFPTCESGYPERAV